MISTFNILTLLFGIISFTLATTFSINAKGSNVNKLFVLMHLSYGSLIISIICLLASTAVRVYDNDIAAIMDLSDFKRDAAIIMFIVIFSINTKGLLSMKKNHVD